MKVLLQDRLDADRYPGGDTIQIKKISEFLSHRGIENFISREFSPNLQQFDLVFLFNLTNPLACFLQSANVIQQKKPYFIFPIYWDLDVAIPRNAYVGIRPMLMNRLPLPLRDFIRRISFIKRFWASVRMKKAFSTLMFNHSKALKNSILTRSSLIFPNSEAECQLLTNQFPDIPANKFQLVRNGCERIDKKQPPENWSLKEGEPFICCVGGIGPRKNQLNLVRAMRDFSLPLILVGPLKPENKAYYNRMVLEKGRKAFFLGPQPWRVVSWILERAFVYVQPSYIETPGLASLEAGLCGCNVVAANVPPVREYFGDLIFYCDPNDVGSIRKAIELASTAKAPNKALSKFVEKEYSWDRTLRPLSEIMEKVTFLWRTNRSLDSLESIK